MRLDMRWLIGLLLPVLLWLAGHAWEMNDRLVKLESSVYWITYHNGSGKP